MASFSNTNAKCFTRFELGNLSQAAAASQRLQTFGFHASTSVAFSYRSSCAEHGSLAQKQSLQARASYSPLKLCCGPGDEREMRAASGGTDFLSFFFFSFCHYRCFSTLRGKHSSQGSRIPHRSRIHPPDFKASRRSSNWVLSFTPPTRSISAVSSFSIINYSHLNDALDSFQRFSPQAVSWLQQLLPASVFALRRLSGVSETTPCL